MSKRSSLAARNSSIQAAMVAAGGSEISATKKALPPKDTSSTKIVGLTVRLPVETHELLRQIAFTQRVSIHSLLMEGVDFVVRKHT